MHMSLLKGKGSTIVITTAESIRQTPCNFGVPDNANVGRTSKGGLEVVMSNVADYLTKLGLESAGLDSAMYNINSTLYTTKVSVRVQWSWLVLPGLLVIFGNLF